MIIFWITVFLLFGFFLLLKAAEIMIDGAAGLGKRYNVPKIIIGLTLVAFGTSAPELAVGILASLDNHGEIVIGNIIGSNIANIALIIGVMAFMKAIPVRQSTVTRGIPLNILAALVFVVLGFDVFFQNGSTTVNTFALGDGLILLFLFVLFLYYVYADLKVAQVLEEEISRKERKFARDKPLILWLMVAGGLTGLLVGGKLVVDNAVAFASFFGISDALIGITIVALGTSLPEMIISIVALSKKEEDLAIGNIVGSNAFNIFLVLGLASVINPVTMETKFISDAVIMIAITVLFFAMSFRRKKLTKAHGVVFVSCYLLYMIFLLVREFGLVVIPG